MTTRRIALARRARGAAPFRASSTLVLNGKFKWPLFFSGKIPPKIYGENAAQAGRERGAAPRLREPRLRRLRRALPSFNRELESETVTE